MHAMLREHMKLGPDMKNTATERRMLPFFVEFVKFSTGFAVIIATSLIALNAAAAAMN